ncbi:MAG: DnaJ domain-containing protein [bacterium]|nr:DnaJ domain-containing protein [bacterium]
MPERLPTPNREPEIKDYYKILGVGQKVAEKDIKTAFRKLSLAHHPDVAGGDSEKFRQINEAYKVLSDHQKRAEYDRKRFLRDPLYKAVDDFVKGFKF